MDTKYSMLAIGALIGGIASAVIAVPSLVPHAVADEAVAIAQPANDFFTGKPTSLDLFKPQWSVDASVSTEVLSSTTIRKIEFGRMSTVTIATTASGTYSSDAMDSPHVRYPGVYRVQAAAGPGALAELTVDGWKLLRHIDAGSFVSIAPLNGGHAVVDETGACVFTKTAIYC